MTSTQARLILDDREIDLIKCLRNKNQCLITRRLNVGDIWIEADDSPIRIVIERKTLKDWHSSLNDGRYATQLYNMQKLSADTHQLFFMIECGSDEKCFAHFDDVAVNNRIDSANESLLMQYGSRFKVLYTSGIEHTANRLMRMVQKLPLSTMAFTQSKAPLQYGSAKSSDFWADPYYYMLLSIPGIGKKSAEGIVKAYSTFASLYTSIGTSNTTLSPSILKKLRTVFQVEPIH